MVETPENVPITSQNFFVVRVRSFSCSHGRDPGHKNEEAEACREQVSLFTTKNLFLASFVTSDDLRSTVSSCSTIRCKELIGIGFLFSKAEICNF
jgi:hypothetical protein